MGSTHNKQLIPSRETQTHPITIQPPSQTINPIKKQIISRFQQILSNSFPPNIYTHFLIEFSDTWFNKLQSVFEHYYSFYSVLSINNLLTIQIVLKHENKPWNWSAMLVMINANNHSYFITGRTKSDTYGITVDEYVKISNNSANLAFCAINRIEFTNQRNNYVDYNAKNILLLSILEQNQSEPVNEAMDVTTNIGVVFHDEYLLEKFCKY